MPDAVRPPGKIGLEGQQDRARLHELRRPRGRFNAWSLDEEASQPFFRQAVELGIDFWDTANVYQFGSSEEFVGRAVKRYTRRENVVLATKVYGKMYDGPGGQGLSRRAIMEQIDGSLTRLGTDFVDGVSAPPRGAAELVNLVSRGSPRLMRRDRSRRSRRRHGGRRH